MLRIGERLRFLRESKGMNQTDVQEKTGLLRGYTSKVENGHIVPTLETLAKYAVAFGIPFYQLFYTGDDTMPAVSVEVARAGVHPDAGPQPVLFRRLGLYVDRLDERSQRAVVVLARTLAEKR